MYSVKCDPHRKRYILSLIFFSISIFCILTEFHETLDLSSSVVSLFTPLMTASQDRVFSREFRLKYKGEEPEYLSLRIDFDV